MAAGFIPTIRLPQPKTFSQIPGCILILRTGNKVKFDA